jgi:hypothetical protein
MSGVWAAARSIASQTVMITALLYYFGWVRTQTTYAYFGIDAGALGFSTTDYVLRSINSTFQPLIGAGLVALGLMAVHSWIVVPAVTAPTRSRTRRFAHVAILTAHAVALVLAAVVAAGLLAQDEVGRRLGFVLPLALFGAAGLFAYVQHLRSLTSAPDGTAPVGFSTAPHSRSLALLALGLVGLLWAVALYATHVGAGIAANIAAGLPTRPDVSVYSTQRIAISGTGIAVDEIQQEGTKYRYRYSGLRLLIHTHDRYLLLPASWQKGRDSVYLIQDNDDIRIDLTAH